MRASHSIYIVLLGILCFWLTWPVDSATNTDCELQCNTTISWDGPEWGCGQNNVTYRQYMCPDSYTYLKCKIQEVPYRLEVGTQYPGVCGCPNMCNNATSQGKCIFPNSGTPYCVCNPGWTGTDCSQLDCSAGNPCYQQQGKCGTVNNVATCICQPNYAMQDCSASIGIPLPPLPEIIPSTQYTSEDNYGEDHPIFNTSTIAQIRITINETDLQFLLDPHNRYTHEYKNAQFWFYNGIEDKTFSSVGFRLKGAGSRNFIKKTWKISFNEFVSGQKWKQVKKLDLKDMSTDASCIREILCRELLFSLNCPVQRMSFAQLFINNQNFGLYWLQENIDSQFLDSRYGNNDGPLYKCDGNFSYLGTNPKSYSSVYQPETDAADNYTSLITFLEILNRANSSQAWAAELESIFNVDLFLRIMVHEVLTGQYDGINLSKNYWLYMNETKFDFIRSDLDLAFGYKPDQQPVVMENVYTWGSHSRGQILINAVFGVPRYQHIYIDYLNLALDKFFNFQTNYVDYAYSLQKMISPGVLRDSWHVMDHAFTYENFLESMHKGWQRGHDYTTSILTFMDLRIGSALHQLGRINQTIGGAL